MYMCINSKYIVNKAYMYMYIPLYHGWAIACLLLITNQNSHAESVIKLNQKINLVVPVLHYENCKWALSVIFAFCLLTTMQTFIFTERNRDRAP